MKKTKKFLSFIVAIVFVIAVFMTSVFAEDGPTHDGFFTSDQYSPFTSITAWYDLNLYEFRAQTLASCSSGHDAIVETEIKWVDANDNLVVVHEHNHGYMGVYAQSTVYTEMNNYQPYDGMYESAHFYMYDWVMRIEAYLPGPSVVVVN